MVWLVNKKETEMKYFAYHFDSKKHMEIQLGIGVLWHCPGMTAREARVAVAEFFSGCPTVAQMRDRIRQCGGFVEAGRVAFEAYDARHPLYDGRHNNWGEQNEVSALR
jgi:hypothetical protein